MKLFLAGLSVGLAVFPIALYVYLVSGAAPVATSAPEMPFEKRIARIARRATILKEMPKTTPITLDETNLLAGVPVYLQHCATCHGLPNHEITAIAKGMYPKPPQLFRGKGVTDDTPGQTYWKVANGIRLSGMPGFKQSLSEQQIWQVSLLLANAHTLPQSVQSALGQTITASDQQRIGK